MGVYSALICVVLRALSQKHELKRRIIFFVCLFDLKAGNNLPLSSMVGMICF